MVESPVTTGDRHVVQLTYSGTPEPVVAPTDRPDFSTTGWTTVSDGSVWTMQEPYGAYTWYAVNDQPSDKAFYDLTIDAPAPMVGVANGRLVSRSHPVGGRTVTHWHAARAGRVVPDHDRDRPLHRDQGHRPPRAADHLLDPDRPAGRARKVRYAPRAIAYLEGLVGRYPFPTLGVLVVPSISAMETQSMITLGENHYDAIRDVVTHELAHQWYGDEVTPDDWSDLWMSEGMATVPGRANWTADHSNRSRDQPAHRVGRTSSPAAGLLRPARGLRDRLVR